MAALTRGRVVAALAVAAVGFGAGFAIAQAGGDEKFPTPSLQPAANSPPIENLERATRLPTLRPATGGGGGGSPSQPKGSTGGGARTHPSPTPTTPSPTETQPPTTGTTPSPPDSSTTPGF